MGAYGKLYVFEGPDGVGKSEISRFFVEHLKECGVECELLSFPGQEAGTLGQHVYQIHHFPERYGIHSLTPTSLQTLHIAAHIDTIERRILPALKRGRTVILDRFWWSTKVYGSVAGVEDKLLNSMIELELMTWGKVKPTALVLIQRKEPLGAEPLRKWRQLCKAYDMLADNQTGGYPIYSINNNGSLKDTKAQLLSLYSGELLCRQASGGQLSLAFESGHVSGQSPYIFSVLPPVRSTVVYETYWQFAAERQAIFFKRLTSKRPPWTHDRILADYKFTNAYRASDRVSQFLIKNVIYTGEDSPEEVFFRTILFKLFNKIETWLLLTNKLGQISYSDYSYKRYDKVLSATISAGQRIYSAAYIMPPGSRIFKTSRKHRAHLKLLERMMEDEVPFRLAETKTMKEGFKLLRSYPLIGDFLAYQFVTDINYSPITNFSEMEFVVPGPGAFSGIHKCFESFEGLSESDVMTLVAERQEEEFKQRGIKFQSLWGRPLQLIDCQNLFCEVDKYARVKHPDIIGISGRTRIKQGFEPNTTQIDYWYPPKWGLNEKIPTNREV